MLSNKGRYPTLYLEIVKAKNVLRPIIDKSNTDEGFMERGKDTLLASNNKEKILSYICQISMDFFFKIHTYFFLVLNILPSS